MRVPDGVWGLGMIVATAAYAIMGSGVPTRTALIALLVLAWGLRLSLHMWWRARRGLGSPSYELTRADRSPWWRGFARISLPQGVLILVVSTPILAATRGHTPRDLTPLDLLGVLVWGVGFACEVVGDTQLARFKADPANRGAVLRTGLWAYSRHPNLFGEATLWWGVFLIALSTPGGWMTVYSPILMTVALLRVSGVAPQEKKLTAMRPGYSAYVATTPAFVPWFPRKAAGRG